MIKVVTVIVNWNGFELTKECLQSLNNLKINKNIDHLVLVVDNGSTDGSVDKLKTLIKDVVILENGKNLGFAGGNNAGIREAVKLGADYIFVLNNDTDVDTNIINEMVKVAESDERIGAVSPKIYFFKGYEFHKKRYKKNQLGKVIWSAGGSIDWNNVYASNRGVDNVDEGQYDRQEETEFATGAATLLKVKALKKVGLYNEKLYLYLEDVDLSLRMKKKNWKIVYSPKSVVWHKVSQSSGIGSNLNDYFISRNRMWFGMKYAPLRSKFALFRESINLILKGRRWQKIGIMDYYIGNFGRGSWQ